MTEAGLTTFTRGGAENATDTVPPLESPHYYQQSRKSRRNRIE
jgi:hypothetical protein